MNASELLLKCLEREGVSHIFGVAGEENLHLLEAISKSNIKYISTRHEQAASFMAATWGRLTGEPGVCLSTLGPGATNLATGAAYAFLGGMPLIMITGQKPIRERTQGNFQIIDVTKLFEPITKYTKQIIDADTIPEIVREAFEIAKNEKPGPVHIELPKDISNDPAQAPENSTGALAPGERVKRANFGVPVQADVSKALEMINSAEAPVLVLAGGANRKNLSKTISDFIEKHNVPFVSTQMGKGAVDERSKYYLGTLALSSKDYVHCVLEKADLIIVAGYDLDQKIPFVQGKAKILNINFSPIGESEYYKPAHEIIGDIGNSFAKLSEKINKKFTGSAEILKLKEKIEEKVNEKSDNDNFPILPQRIVRDVRSAVPEDGIICLDNGMYKLWFARGFQAYASNTILLDNALATMGAGLPSAIMAKMLYPERFVLSVCGDGGFMMSSAEVETALRLGLDLVVLVVNDNGFGMIEWEQKEKNYAPFGLKFNNPDFVKYAESFGAKGARAEKAGDLLYLIERARKEGGVWVIEAPVDYSENIRVFTEELSRNVCDF